MPDYNSSFLPFYKFKGPKGKCIIFSNFSFPLFDVALDSLDVWIRNHLFRFTTLIFFYITFQISICHSPSPVLPVVWCDCPLVFPAALSLKEKEQFLGMQTRPKLILPPLWSQCKHLSDTALGWVRELNWHKDLPFFLWKYFAKSDSLSQLQERWDACQCLPLQRSGQECSTWGCGTGSFSSISYSLGSTSWGSSSGNCTQYLE